MNRRARFVDRRVMERQQALVAASDLAGWFRAGGDPQPFACPVRLDAGEVCFGSGVVGLAQYFGLDTAGYTQSMFIAGGGVGMIGATAAVSALGNANRRKQAVQRAAVQWREFGMCPAVVTSRRTMACEQGRWLSWWHGQVRQVIPDLAGLNVVLLFDDERPTSFTGTFAPWLSVLLVKLIYGEVLDAPDPRLQLPGGG
jgi:hypothetical protein